MTGPCSHCRSRSGTKITRTRPWTSACNPRPQDPGRLLGVLRERLERLSLPQAVRGIRLEAPTLLRFNAGQHSLFRDTPAEQQQDIRQLAERLQARLGSGAVSGLTGVEDHRPEYSWRSRTLDERPGLHRPGPPPRLVAAEPRNPA